jgi:hypothetical protein
MTVECDTTPPTLSLALSVVQMAGFWLGVELARCFGTVSVSAAQLLTYLSARGSPYRTPQGDATRASECHLSSDLVASRLTLRLSAPAISLCQRL